MKSTLSIKVTEKEKLQLKRVAERSNKTPSDLMREALDLILRDPDVSSGGSCFELAEDLFPEAVKTLPRDLSSNKNHLAGFGK